MTAYRIVELLCDYVKCDESYSIGAVSAWRTRRMATDDGWVSSKDVAHRAEGLSDFCPNHAKSERATAS